SRLDQMRVYFLYIFLLHLGVSSKLRDDEDQMPPDKTQSDDHRKGDKVRIRSGPPAGLRATVNEVCGRYVSVDLGNGEMEILPADDLTNFSRAARRAWRAMPKKTGRPRLL